MYKAVIILFAAVSLAISKPVEDDSNYQERIVGGEIAPNGSFPFMVSLRSKDSNNHFCGGFILTRLTIATAGHCVAGETPETMEVVAGTNHIKEGGTRYGVKRMIFHPGFEYWYLKDDVSLVFLSEPIEFNDIIQPIALGEAHVPAGVVVRLAGWGRTSYPGDLSEQLQSINLVTVENDFCRNQLLGIGAIFDSSICTLTKSGEGSCQGDSGGALVAEGKVVGIVSWGSPCAKGLPDVFCRISEVFRWMTANIE